MVDFCGIELEHPIINASGTFDAIAARGCSATQLIEHFPFAAFVSKTVTLAPAAGQSAPAAVGAPAGLINSIGLPNKGLERYLADDLPPWPPARAADRQRDGLQPRRGGRAGQCLRVPGVGGGARAQRLLPECRDRPDHGRRPREVPAARRASAR